MGTFLENLSEWNAKSALVIKDLALAGKSETASLLMSLRSVANDETLSNETRLDALTALINRGELLDVPLPPYYPLAFTFPLVEKYVGLHNDLSGLNTGNYWHLTYQEYLDVLNKPGFNDFSFANLTGEPNDNGNLAAALAGKQDTIAAGTNGQFFAWDKTMRFVDWANLANKPTTLAGLGISVGDTLFDSKYLQQSSIINSYTLGANQIVNNTDSLIGAIGKLQGQINSIASGGGSISTVGIAMPNIFSVGNSPLTGAGGTINVTLQSQLAKRFFASPNGASGAPDFREIVAADLPTSGITAGTYGNTTNWPLITVDTYGRVTNVTLQAATSGGTVGSVGLSAPAGFTVSGSPVTTNGTLGFSWVNQPATYVLAGPVSGAAAAPSFRALVDTDIPVIQISQVFNLQTILNSITTGSLSDLARNAIYIGNGSNAAVASEVAGDLGAAFLDNAGTNQAVFTIQDEAVTWNKIQDVNTGKLLGRYNVLDGPIEYITLDPLAFTLNTGTGELSLATPNPALLTSPGDLLTSDGVTQVKLTVGADATFLIADSAQTVGIKWAALSGDATIDVAGAMTIAAGAVTVGKMANAPAFSILGNDTSSTTNPPAYLTKAQATTLIDSFNAGANLPGLVPNGSGNDSSKFLSGAGTWLTISGGAGTTTNPVIFNITGGAAPNTSFNGSAQVTVDYSTVGAPSVSGLGATGTWPIAISGNAGTVTDGVYTSSTYNNPSWIGSLAGSKITGNISGSSGSVANSLFIGSGLAGSTFNGSANVTISIDFTSTNIWTNLQTFEGQIAVGKLTSSGSVKLFGSTSGFVTLQAPPAPDSTTYTLPSAVGAVGQYLKLSAGNNLVWDTPGGIGGTVTQYAVLVGGAANTVVSLAPGSQTGQLLRYVSGSNNPAWTTAVYPNTTTQNRILYSSSNNVIDEIGSPSNNTFLQFVTGTGYSWANAVTGITLTAGTQGIITNTGTASAPILSVSGNQGGLVYFVNSATWGTTGQLDQGELVIGGGAGAPSTINSGADGTLLISNGPGNAPSWTAAVYPSTTQINRILFSSSNNIVDQITAPTTGNTFLQWNGSSFTWAAAGGGGGSGTVSTGDVGQLAVYTGTTTVNGFPSTNSIIYGNASGDVDNLVFSSAVQNLYLRVNSSGTGLVWDTAGGSGSGTVNSGQQFAVAYYPATGTAVDDITPPTTNGGYFLHSPVTASAAVAPEWLGSTGTGLVARASGPTFTTPNLGAATAASINGLAITSSTGTLAIANGSTLATVGAFSTTLTATALTSVTLPTTGTLATLAGIETLSNKTLLSPQVGASGTDGHIHFRKAGGAIPPGFANYATMWFPETGGSKRMAIMWDNTGYASEFQLNATATQTYTFPNATGTVALIDATQTLTIPAAGATSADIALGVSGGGTVSLVAPATVTGAGAYTLPDAYPTGPSQFLTADSFGEMSWITITGGGNVSGPASSATGDFAVFADTSGTLIGESAAASLTAAGRATFNSGVDVGVSGTGGTTGTVVFRAATSNFTTALQQSTASTQTMAYIWPVAGPLSNGQVLSSTTGGQLSWASAGSGDMTLAGTQTVTGIKTFGQPTSVGQLRIAGNTSGSITLAAPASAIGTITFPNGSDTLAGFGSVNTFSAANTFNTGAFTVNSAATFSSTIIMSGGAGVNFGQLNFTNITSNHINFGGGSGAFNVGGGSDQPRINSRSAGAKIIIRGTYTSGRADTAIGWNAAANDELWIGTATTLTQIGFYMGDTRAVWIAGTGAGNTGMNLLAGYNYNINSLKVVGARITGYGTPTGADRTVTFAATTNVERVVAALVADLKTHGLIG